MVRAKFKCTQITENEGGAKNVKMSAVYGTNGENKDFTDITPSGSFEINITGGAPASDYFKPGKQYYFNIEVAE